jgi:hypothetical protein
MRILLATSPATGVSPWSAAANVLLGVPFQLEAARTTFYKAYWVMGSAGGTANREVGIYDEDFVKVVTTGAVAGNNANSVPQVAALTATTTLGPGRYYMVMGYAATTTNTHFRWSLVSGQGQIGAMGCWDTGAITLGSLPSPATPTSWGRISLPQFGLITRSAFDL